MLKAQTAFTQELDDPKAAAEEILSQLDLGALLKNSVGIITFYQDAHETGVLEAIAEALPFDTVGCTVLSGGTQRGFGFEQVSVAVLSSDDLEFSTAVSEEITYSNAEEASRKCYRDARSRLGGEPSLILAFGPITRDISGDRYTVALDSESGGTPIFGTLSNTGIVYEDARVAYNGRAERMLLSLVLVHGDAKPRFYTRAVSDSNITKRGAIITQSDGYLLQKINDVSVEEYLASIGVETVEGGATASLPILVDYKDGTRPTAYSMYANTDKGMLVGGAVPIGAEIAFADIDYDSIMATAEDALEKLISDLDGAGASIAFIIPCLSRCLTLGAQSEDEMLKSQEMLRARVPYMFMYSGGEICPVPGAGGQLVNRFHNLTYTAMTLG
jgi:hypothetical protein